MKIALVHDHLAQDGGAEKVLKAFHEIWPDAPIFVLVHDPEVAHPIFKKADIHTSFIQKLPLGVRKYQWYLPFMPSATERFDLNDFDVVLTSTSALAKGVITHTNTIHIAYCHSPTRYLWTDTHQYVNDLPYNRFVKTIIRFYLTFLRMWDLEASTRVDTYISNSDIVKRRIKKYYKRDSVIIHPPVETSAFTPATNIAKYFLIGGRLVHYKRYDIAIQAFNNLRLPLKVFGDGPAMSDLKAMAKDNIEFVGRVSAAELKKLYQECQALIFPQEEDFGIVPLEAMASGRPVIAYKAGGALETVIEGKTGLFFPEQTWESLSKALVDFNNHSFDAKAIRAHAERFDSVTFKKRIKTFVEEAWEKFQKES